MNTWYNFKDKQPKFIHNMPDIYGTIKYSNPIIVLIKNIPLLCYYTKQPFIEENGNTVYDIVLETPGYTLQHLMEMKKLDFIEGTCFSLDEIYKYGVEDVFWTEIDLIDVFMQTDLLKKENHDGNTNIKGDTN